MLGIPLLQTFVPLVSSAWNALPQPIHMAQSHILSLLKWHLPDKAFSDHLNRNNTSSHTSNPSYPALCLFFPHRLYHVQIPPFECMLHKGRDLYQFCLPMYPMSLEQCLECNRFSPTPPHLLYKYNREVDLRANKGKNREDLAWSPDKIVPEGHAGFFSIP